MCGGKYFSEYNNANNDRIISIFPLLTRLLWKTSSLFIAGRHFIPSAWLRRVAAVRSGFVLGGSSLFNVSQSVGKFGKLPAVIGPRGVVVKNKDSTQHLKLGHTPPPSPTNTKKMKEIKCQHVIFKVLTCERNCACNYEQAEVLAYKQEKLTASWVFGPVFWLAVCLAVALAFILMPCLHAFLDTLQVAEKLSLFLTFYWPVTNRVHKKMCCARLWWLGWFHVTFGRMLGRMSVNATFFGSLCVRERDAKWDVAVISA